MANGIYAYGVLDDDSIELSMEGVHGADHIYTVKHNTLSAIVSDIDTLDPEETDENTRAHDRVLQAVLTHDGGRTIVPMQFGMAFRGPRTLKNVLRGARPVFSRTLREIDGKVEVGLKVLTQADGSADGEEIEAAIAEELEPIVDASVDNDLFSDRLVVNRSYLIDRESRDRIDGIVAELEVSHPDFIIQYTGPWAPYNFVDIEIGGRS